MQKHNVSNENYICVKKVRQISNFIPVSQDAESIFHCATEHETTCNCISFLCVCDIDVISSGASSARSSWRKRYPQKTDMAWPCHHWVVVLVEVPLICSLLYGIKQGGVFPSSSIWCSTFTPKWTYWNLYHASATAMSINTVESFIVVVSGASSRCLLDGNMFSFYGSQTIAPPGAELLSNFLPLIHRLWAYQHFVLVCVNNCFAHFWKKLWDCAFVYSDAVLQTCIRIPSR